MRDLLFKNFTSNDKRKKILASSEVQDKQGVRSVIQRHLICIIKEVKPTLANKSQVKENPTERPLPYLYVLKEHNSKEQEEKFLCRLKGSMYIINNSRIFFVRFMHSLKIDLKPTPQGLKDYTL